MKPRCRVWAGSALLILIALATTAFASLLIVEGQITEVRDRGRKIAVRTQGETLTLATDAATRVTVRGVEIAPAELKPGNTIRVKYASVHGTNMAAEIWIETD